MFRTCCRTRSELGMVVNASLRSGKGSYPATLHLIPPLPASSHTGIQTCKHVHRHTFTCPKSVARHIWIPTLVTIASHLVSAREQNNHSEWRSRHREAVCTWGFQAPSTHTAGSHTQDLDVMKVRFPELLVFPPPLGLLGSHTQYLSAYNGFGSGSFLCFC